MRVVFRSRRSVTLIFFCGVDLVGKTAMGITLRLNLAPISKKSIGNAGFVSALHKFTYSLEFTSDINIRKTEGMKNTNRLVSGAFSSVLLSAGLTKAAGKFDPLNSKNSKKSGIRPLPVSLVCEPCALERDR